MSERAIDAILEIFTWTGFGGAVVFGLVAVIGLIADGSWVAAQIVIADDEHGRIARWFGNEGRVGQARLTHDQVRALAGRETADAFVRLGTRDKVRLTRGSPFVRLFFWLSMGMLALGILSAGASLAVLFMR
ncbi:hypothetical protein [Microbacterium sp. SLBN-146]|uniref:hypothetical protein n=1 Tax=Microbacterium sp. SLBN-146 TaxID=2768457 RepID=UPI001171C039|nr:hypothetical protein [Microbacterium sp. SLBN-146]TQJ31394.1 hypothetical protein FBY39_1863 [Microbacterium sp. SLBN-146]